ncbi:MAG: EAL domain-containing protein, partial [Synergistaceae bacterium]|nr:EAL domain-containing protein [Synergistaceae bacterium]
EVSEDHRANIIIAAVIGMAQRLGIPALSKGVETQEQLEFLKQAGCDLAQGYLFGKAMSGEDIERHEHIIN